MANVAEIHLMMIEEHTTKKRKIFPHFFFSSFKITYHWSFWSVDKKKNTARTITACIMRLNWQMEGGRMEVKIKVENCEELWHLIDYLHDLYLIFSLSLSLAVIYKCMAVFPSFSLKRIFPLALFDIENQISVQPAS